MDDRHHTAITQSRVAEPPECVSQRAAQTARAAGVVRFGVATALKLKSDALPADSTRKLHYSQWLWAHSLGLAGVLIAAKFCLLPFPVHSASELLRWALRWGVVAAADVAFVAWLALAMGLIASGWNRTFAILGIKQGATHHNSGPVDSWTKIGLTTGAYALAAIYGAVSVSIFRATMVPLSWQVLSFAGGPKLMASSVAPFVSYQAVLGLVASAGVPMLIAVWLKRRGAGLKLLPGAHAGLAAVSAAVLTAGICQAYVHHAWTDPNRWERRISVNPHSVLAVSCLQGLISGRELSAFSGEPTDVSDFMPAAGEPPAAVNMVHPAPNEGQAALTAIPSRLQSWQPGSRGDGTRQPQNVVVIVLESVGVEYLSLYGASPRTQPRLAELANSGCMLFENVYCHAPSSPKGLVAITAGVYPGVDWKLITRDSPEFAVPTLAELLKQHGYTTAYMHSGFWGWKDRDRYLRARGVDYVWDASCQPAEQVNSWGVSDACMFDRAQEWIDANRKQPFHLLLWTIETHHPYVAPANGQAFGTNDAELERYLNALVQVDQLIANFWQQLQAKGLAENTLLVVTGDHGEAFGQHGQRVHSYGIYEENVHVPLLVLHPSLQTQERVPAVIEHIDIAPLIAGWLGLEQPLGWQGSHRLANQTARPAYFYSMSNDVLLGLRDGPLKYHYYLASGYQELFDLRSDPNELHNLAAEFPELCQKYHDKVAGLVKFQREFLARHGAE